MFRKISSAFLVALIFAFSVALPSSSRAEYAVSKIILALDVSGSMRGGGISTLTKAANRLISELPKDKQLSIYAFSSEPQLIQDFTSDQERLSSSLGQVASGGDTALYDSILQLLSIATSQSPSIIIFTDGKDSSSKNSLDSLLSSLSKSGIKINFVTYQVGDRERANLDAIARATSGGIYNASTIGELASSFTAALTNVTATTSPTPDSTPLPPRSTERSSSIPLLIAVLASLISGFFFQVFNSARRRSKFVNHWSDVLDSYEIRKRDAVEEKAPSLLRVRIEALLFRALGDIGTLFPASSERRKRITILIGGYLVVLALFSLSALPFALSLLVTSALYLLALRLYIQRKTDSVLTAFETDLPGSLKLISASLAAGLSFLQALETFVTENKSEVARQFRRALSEIQMGTPVEKALNGVAQRMKSKDLEWTVFAFSVQREVGGSLAKILATTAETIESRAEIRREVRTLSAEGRLSSYILMALPIGIFLFLLFARPQFVSIFWREQIGHILLGFIGFSMLMAWLWIRRLIRISV